MPTHAISVNDETANETTGNVNLSLLYIVLLTQNGTGAPTLVNTFQNTIGDIVWTRLDAGSYVGTLAGAFPVGKTVIPPFGGSVYQVLPLYNSVPGDSFYQLRRLNDNSVKLDILDSAAATFDLSDIGNNIPIFVEIRVYP